MENHIINKSKGNKVIAQAFFRDWSLRLNRFEIKEDQHPLGVSLLYHPGSTSIDFCQRLCQDNGKCSVYIYSRKYKGCYLAKGEITGWKSWEEGFAGVKK